MSITRGILTVLSRARNGETSSVVERHLNDAGIYPSHETSVAAALCMLVKRGLVYRDGSYRCEGCGTNRAVYRISERGRIFLADSPVTQNILEEV